MLPSRKIHIRIDAESGRLVTPEGARVIRDAELPRFFSSDLVVACVEFVQVAESGGTRTLTPKGLPDTSLYVMLGGADGVAELLFRSEQDGTNLPGSWLSGEDPDPEQGQLTFVLNTGTTGFASALSGRRSLRCDFAVTAVAAGAMSVEVLAKDAFFGERRPDATAAHALADNCVTVQQLAAYFSADAGFEFSRDRAEWHDDRAGDDLYYRYKSGDGALTFCIGPAAATATVGKSLTDTDLYLLQ